LMISILLLVVIFWLEKPRRLLLALISGGILGISLLIRTQILILLPVILIIYWFASRKIIFRSLVFPIALFLAGFIIAVAPWLIRNYRITGQFVFDHPDSQTRVMAQRYSPETELTELDRKPDETTGEYNQRLSEFIRYQMLHNTGSLVQFTARHWLNNEIANLLIFPIRFSINSPAELFIPQHAFWEEWDGRFTPGQLFIFLINLSILTVGLVALSRRNIWAGLLPLAFNVSYHFSNAAVRFSGWRYIIPADWIFILYFAAGIFFLVNFNAKNSIVDSGKLTGIGLAAKNRWLQIGFVAVLILLIGCLPVLAEKVFPRIYPPASIESARKMLTDENTNLSSADQAGIENILKDPSVIVLNGRMLYPRYYDAREGEENTGKTGYAPLPFGRYVFLIAGEPDGTVIFPYTSPDLLLRNAENALIIGCLDGFAINARLVSVPSVQSQPFIASGPVDWTCTSKK
jgi:hypothetical protein